MKTKNWMSATAVGTILLLGSSACSTDWGKMDPPAGISTSPKLENIATYEFEDENLDPMIFKAKGADDNQLPAIVNDDDKGSVLELNDGWVETNNPLTQTTCEKAVSLTFWMKQIPAVEIDEEGNEIVEPQDLTSPLLVFLNENRSSHFSISANGWLDYDAADGTWSDNNPTEYKTGYMPAGQWNYVAMVIRDKGYDLYVNGEKKTSKNVDNFDCSKIVAFMNNVSTVSIGSADNHGHWMMDDLKFYRNELTDKEISRPRLPGESSVGGGEEIDLSKWILVGLEDNTTAFWTEFSPYFSLTGDGEIHYQFYNYTNGTANWNNWLLVVANGERDSDGYLEYAVARADAWGWGANWNPDAVNHNFNWDTFTQDMSGALVDLTIERSGEDVTCTVVVTTTSGAVFNYTFSFTGVTTESITTWLFCEGSHLLLNPEGCFIGTDYPDGLAVGPQDCSAAWWSVWTPLNRLEGDFENFGIIFTNHTTGTANNWNNWLLICTNGTWIGDDGYAEHFVLRADAWGWGDENYNAENVSHNFNWDTYVADMKDAKCYVYLERSGDELTMVARQITADGRTMPEYRFTYETDDPVLGLFFTMELAWLEIHKVGFFPLVSMNPEN